MPPATLVEVLHKDGTLAFKCWEKDGLRMPLAMKDPDARFQELKELEYKDGDIIIATYPKVGSQWLKDSIAMLVRGKAEVAWVGTILEIMPTLENYKNEDTRRIAITHVRTEHISESQKANAKFIIALRNPKDAAVSMMYHYQKDPSIRLQGSWDQVFELYISKQAPFGWFFDFYRDWQKFIESHADQVLVVYYEDMQKNYQHELKRIADFLEIPASDDLIAQVAEKGQLKTFREEVMKLPIVQSVIKWTSTDGSLPMYRKGEVGDWKNHFTVAQSEMFDTIIEQEMKDLMFKPFVYSL